MRAGKIFLVLALLLLPHNLLADGMPTNPKDIYFLKVKADDENQVQKDMENGTCQNLKAVYPKIKTVDEFISLNSCNIQDRGTHMITANCLSMKGGPYVFVFDDLEGCEAIISYSKELFNKPGIGKDLENANDAKWFMFESYTQPKKYITACVDSPYQDPSEVLQKEGCKVNSINHLVQSFKCSKDDNGYIKAFVRSKAMCEHVKDLVTKRAQNDE